MVHAGAAVIDAINLLSERLICEIFNTQTRQAQIAAYRFASMLELIAPQIPACQGPLQADLCRVLRLSSHETVNSRIRIFEQLSQQKAPNETRSSRQEDGLCRNAWERGARNDC